MKKTNRTITGLTALLICLVLAACHPMQGKLVGDFYYAPSAAYSLDLSDSAFRGQIKLDERCNNTGGSTTIWDEYGRMFRIDYLSVKDSPLVNAPRFASDMTLLNLVLNNYLRDRLAKSPIITSVKAAHREFIDSTDPKSVFAIVKLVVNGSNTPDQAIPNGVFYYGFLLFKKHDNIYVIQHRQPIMAAENMKETLLNVASAMDIPGHRFEVSNMDRLRHLFSKIAPGDKTVPIHLCKLGPTP